jgi:uncharacterized damage-inducible protein DinB
MNATDLALLVDYNYWARDRVLDAVAPLPAEQFARDMGSSFGSIRGTLAHVYSAEWVWYSRWMGTSPTEALALDQFPDVSTLRATWSTLEADIRRLISGLDQAGIGRVHEYRLISGKPGRAVFWQMLQHVVNHGSYHRGQVTTLLRQLGAPPPKSLDLITFYREREG